MYNEINVYVEGFPTEAYIIEIGAVILRPFKIKRTHDVTDGLAQFCRV